MRNLLSGLALIGLALVLGAAADAGGEKKGKKEETLKGKITCAKCDLGVETACKTVIVVTGKDKKDVTYYFDAAADKKNHGAICSEAKAGSVTGVVGKDGKKATITVKTLKFDD